MIKETRDITILEMKRAEIEKAMADDVGEEATDPEKISYLKGLLGGLQSCFANRNLEELERSSDKESMIDQIDTQDNTYNSNKESMTHHIRINLERIELDRPGIQERKAYLKGQLRALSSSYRRQNLKVPKRLPNKESIINWVLEQDDTHNSSIKININIVESILRLYE